MKVVDEWTACCYSPRSPQGCSDHQPRWFFTDERASTVCDVCKWRLGIEKERIAPIYASLLAARRPENKYQKAAQAQQVANRERKREEYLQGAIRIRERGEKITIKSITAETGYTQSDIYNYFPKKPCAHLTELADHALREKEGAHA
jgi:hypothetical protein